jgi:hypothetical protein
MYKDKHPIATTNFTRLVERTLPPGRPRRWATGLVNVLGMIFLVEPNENTLHAHICIHASPYRWPLIRDLIPAEQRRERVGEREGGRRVD